MKISDLVDAVAAKAELNKTSAKAAIEAAFGAIASELAGKGSLTVPGFGTFSTKDRPAKQGRNPQTGETIQIAAKTVAGFKPAKALADSING